MLSKIFHKKTTSERPYIPERPSDWPWTWSTIFFKEYPRFEAISLPKNILKLQTLETTLSNRKSSRIFDVKEFLSLQELSTILYYGAGIKNNDGIQGKDSREERNKTRRFYPSGGARYPLEIYAAIKRVSGVTPGIYHYSVARHSLERLLGKKHLKESDDTLGYPWAKDASVVFIVTAVWDRNFIKYHDFGYNIILIETGHMVQNLLLVSESLGMHYCPLAGFNNQKMNVLLDIDGEDESSLYIIAIGK